MSADQTWFYIVWTLCWTIAGGVSLWDPRVYNYYFYINTNPDLREAGLFSKEDARNHWLTYGIEEGRQACGSFHTLQYLDNYPSLKQKFGTNYTQAIEYYLNYGYSIGRFGYTIGGL